MERAIVHSKNIKRNRIKINFYAPFWQILKVIGVTIGVLSVVVLFYMFYILMWVMMGC